MSWTSTGVSLRGPTGPAGEDVAVLIFTQDMPSDTWVIPHSLNRNPGVIVTDSTGRQVIVAVEHSLGVVTIRADAVFAGQARLI